MTFFFTCDVSIVASTSSTLVGRAADVSPPAAESSSFPHAVIIVATAKPAPNNASNRLLRLI
jgi:hypothetical protein